MKKSIILIIALSLTTLLATGCRTNPVRNISDAPTMVSESASMDGIRDAIVRAGQSLGWVMKADARGHILGTLYLRDHVAVVDVNYDHNNYSITYKDSTNLKYDGTNIHKNYNGWIQNLDNAIKQQLGAL